MAKEYFLAPNFTTGPPPRGPIKLGTILRNVHDFYPLNQQDELPVVASQLAPVDTQHSVEIDLLLLQADNQTLTSRALGRLGLGAEPSFQRAPCGDPMISCKRLETLAFEPTDSNIKESIENVRVKSYMTSSRFKRPVYMVTGLKIASGTATSSHLFLPNGMTLEQNWRESDDFIIAFKVIMIWLDLRGEVKYKGYSKGAWMVEGPSFEGETAPTGPICCTQE